MNQTVSLRDVIIRVQDKVNKDTCGLMYYVGGEHFEYGESVLKKKGLIAGSTIGPAFQMRFQPNDVLLMSRNPHLRKASMVNFEGICSDVSYVCRTENPSVLLQRLIPFIFQSDFFWDYAESHKHGSTNYFLNWKDFEGYQFSLPSIDEQERISTLLWSMERTKQAYKQLLAKTDNLVKARFIEMFGEPYSNTHSLSIYKLDDLCDVTKLAGYEYTEHIHYQETGDVIMIKGLNVKEKHLKLDNISYIDTETSDSLPRSQLHEGDIVMTYIGINLGDVAIVDGKNRYHLAPNVSKISVKDPDVLSPEFLVNQIYYSRDKFTRNAGNTAKAVLNMAKIRQIEILLPNIELQRKYIDFVKQSDKSKLAIQQALEKLNKAQKTLINQCFQ